MKKKTEAGIIFGLALVLESHAYEPSDAPQWSEPLEEEKERCSGSYRLAVGFLVIKDESISERPG